MAIDRVQPLKLESSTSGTELDEFPTALDKNEDYVDARGIALQDGTSDDETTLIDRSGNDARFKDGNNTSYLTLTQLYAQQRAVSAYNSIFTMPTKSGTSDYVPFNTTEFEVGGTSQHDPTVGDSGTATGTQTSTTLQDTSKSWTTDQFAGHTVQLTGGTGSGQWREIVSNTSNTLTVGAWDTTPDGTSTYSITEKATRLVVPIDGVYEVIGHAAISYHAGVVGMYFYVNGSLKSLHYSHQSQTIELHIGHSRLFNLSQNDYLQMKIYNGDGSPRDLFAGIYRLTFQMRRVGGGE